ncbi:MAG: EF-P lysine aminoacylase EpmA [Silanimonas sp.]
MPGTKHESRHAALRLRARLNALLRDFFATRGVIEVETPVLSRAGNTDPNIASFSLDFSGPRHDGPRRRWLRTSPEFPLKRLLAEGFGDCYELGRVFRDGEAGGRHNPEFTMLEWYRVGWNHVRLADETVALVAAALGLVGRAPSSLRTLDFATLYREAFGFDPHTADIETLRAPLADVAIDPEGLTRDDWLDLLMTHRLQPSFAADAVTVVHDWPATQCALARIRRRDGAPPVAERFELYLGPLEVANGYHELNDAAEQRARFGRDLSVRVARGAMLPPVDDALLAALPSMPDCAGVALGVDRLLMAMVRSDRIADVLAYDVATA